MFVDNLKSHKMVIFIFLPIVKSCCQKYIAFLINVNTNLYLIKNVISPTANDLLVKYE